MIEIEEGAERRERQKDLQVTTEPELIKCITIERKESWTTLDSLIDAFIRARFPQTRGQRTLVNSRHVNNFMVRVRANTRIQTSVYLAMRIK